MLRSRVVDFIGAALFFFALTRPQLCHASIQHVSGGFLFTGTASSVLISDTNGAILSAGTAAPAAASSGENGLWSLTYKEGGGLNATVFNSASAVNTFQWSLPANSNLLVLTYSNAAIVVTITASNRDDGIDLSAQVRPTALTVLEFALPGRLRFAPANVQRLITPLASADGVGAAFNSGFFQSQPATHPAGWVTGAGSPAGYASLYGGGLVFRPDNDPPAPVIFTTNAQVWLGSAVVTKWTGTNAIVNRPSTASQSDLTLVDSTNGPFFAASHLGGSGLLFRLGGNVDDARAPFAASIVTAAIEHLAQSPHAGRTKVALVALERGPASGGWASVAVNTWRNNLKNSMVLSQQAVQVVELSNVQDMLEALAATNYLAVLNPYGEWTPVLEGPGLTNTIAAVGKYVRAGGNWFEVGGYSFYYALSPTHYYSYATPYPSAFADFLQLESTSGNLALFGVQPQSLVPWQTNTIFVPGRLAWGADATGGYCERAFETYVAPGQTWSSPVVRIAIGHSAAAALQSYAQANNYVRTLTDKMTPTILDQFKRSVLVNYGGNAATKLAHLAELPSPSIVHFSEYLMGGFDKQYPDHLPPNASFGTAADFTNFLAQCRQRGLLTMPYTNPTWWCDHPRGPTFLANGTAPLLQNLDGSLSYEIYGVNDGYTVSHWHPAVRAANQNTVTQFHTNYPVDLLFEDQCGARSWQYDLNPASPTPYAYADGIAQRTAEDSQTFPLATENGWDRIINFESEFCGMTWGIVPTSDSPGFITFLRDRFSPAVWSIYPLAEQLAHDKVAMIHHDLGQFVTTDEVLSWSLGLGYGMSYRLDPAQLDQPGPRNWLLWLDHIQKSVVARYTGQPLTGFTHNWGADTNNPDNGVIQSTYGPVSILANLSPQPLVAGSQTLAPFGFYATAPGVVAAHTIPAGSTNSAGVSYVIETNATGADVWIYSGGDQNATITLPPGFGSVLQLDGHAASLVQGSNATVALGLTPTQDRILPPPELATNPPSAWPGNKPAIGVLNIAGMASSWTTITIANWMTAFNNSKLATLYGLPIRQITNFNDLIAALQSGPTNWFSILNPYGESFPESAAGQWTNTLNAIRDYVNHGGNWWETAGYTFYSPCAPQSGTCQSEVIGPSGIGYLGIPVGTGDINQPAELLTVTPAGLAMFGPNLAGQFTTLSSSVNRGLLRTDDDPGHIALLAGASADFMGAYRLQGWGYLWRLGGFFPNPNLCLSAVPAALTWLYTNAPQPAVAGPVKYLWHGTLTTPAQPTLHAALLGTNLLLQITNCPPGATNYLERTVSLGNPTWQSVFTSTNSQTNWTDPAISGLPAAFYRIRSDLGF